jgi:hypothetical protein
MRKSKSTGTGDLISGTVAGNNLSSMVANTVWAGMPRPGIGNTSAQGPAWRLICPTMKSRRQKMLFDLPNHCQNSCRVVSRISGSHVAALARSPNIERLVDENKMVVACVVIHSSQLPTPFPHLTVISPQPPHHPSTILSRGRDSAL